LQSAACPCAACGSRMDPVIIDKMAVQKNAFLEGIMKPPITG